MSEKKAINDSTIARIAGNIAGHCSDRVIGYKNEDEFIAELARITVKIARAIAAEVERTHSAD